jgi:hypothetical protein
VKLFRAGEEHQRHVRGQECDHEINPTGRGETSFAKKPSTHVRRIEAMIEHFQADTAAGGKILRLIDGPHAAAPQHTEQSIAAKFTRKIRLAGG